MTELNLLAETFENLWPSSNADEWDAPGFSISTPSDVTGVLLSVDLTGAVVAEARERGCQLIFTHHPFLLKGTNEVTWDGIKGSVIQAALASGISVFSAHTNADVVASGVSDTLATAFNLLDVVPLVSSAPGIGHGRIGRLASEITLQEFAVRVAEVLPFTARGIAVAGDPDQLVSTVALCGGAGDSFIANAFDAGADVYVTSDLRHHVASDAVQRPRVSEFSLIDISHWAAESLWLEVAASQLAKVHPEVEFLLSEVVTDPWTFSLNKGNE